MSTTTSKLSHLMARPTKTHYLHLFYSPFFPLEPSKFVFSGYFHTENLPSNKHPLFEKCEHPRAFI